MSEYAFTADDNTGGTKIGSGATQAIRFHGPVTTAHRRRTSYRLLRVRLSGAWRVLVGRAFAVPLNR